MVKWQSAAPLRDIYYCTVHERSCPDLAMCSILASLSPYFLILPFNMAVLTHTHDVEGVSHLISVNLNGVFTSRYCYCCGAAPLPTCLPTYLIQRSTYSFASQESRDWQVLYRTHIIWCFPLLFFRGLGYDCCVSCRTEPQKNCLACVCLRLGHAKFILTICKSARAINSLTGPKQGHATLLHQTFVVERAR